MDGERESFVHDDGGGPYTHCPRCGGRLESRIVFSHDPERLVCSSCRFVYYLDPKVAVGAICRTEGRIVLLRRAIEPAYGKWVFPGGYVDRGESLQEAARRETREEIGAEIRLSRLVNVYSYTGRPVIVVVYEAEVVGGEIRGGSEALEVDTFAPGEIPWEGLAFRSTREALQECLRGIGRPVDGVFDERRE
jgi:ADP-ribose pyrophosphatase YjhB (NUDIX family)